MTGSARIVAGVLVAACAGACELVGGIVERSSLDAGAGAIGGSAGTSGSTAWDGSAATANGGAGGVGGVGGVGGAGGSADAADGPAGAALGSVSVLGSGAAEVAQGASATLVLSGTALDTVTNVVVDGSIACAIGTQSAQEIRCTLAMPHGAVLGADDTARSIAVAVSDAAGPIAGSPGQISLTPIHVATGGSDVEGTGSPSKPFRTLSFALLANGGAMQRDVIVLGTGTYSAQTGELWPVHLPPGVCVRGQGGVTLLGTPLQSFVEQTNGGSSALSPTRLRNLKIAGFDDGVAVTGSGHLLLEDVQIESTVRGVYLAGSVQATLRGNSPGKCAISGSALEGLGTTGSAAATVQSCDFFGNGTQGVRVTASSSVSIQGGSIQGNGISGTIGWDRSNVYAKEQAKLAISGAPGSLVEIAGAAGCGVWIQHTGDALTATLAFVHIHDNFCGIYHQGGDLSVSDASLEKHTDNGIAIYDSGEDPGNLAKIRRTTIATSGQNGLLFDALDTSLDLGSLSDPGNVHFRDNLANTSVYTGKAQLLHATSDTLSGPVTAVGVTFQWSSGGGIVDPNGVPVGPDALIVAGKPHWRIVNTGHAIDFGP